MRQEGTKKRNSVQRYRSAKNRKMVRVGISQTGWDIYSYARGAKIGLNKFGISGHRGKRGFFIRGSC